MACILCNLLRDSRVSIYYSMKTFRPMLTGLVSSKWYSVDGWIVVETKSFPFKVAFFRCSKSNTKSKWSLRRFYSTRDSQKLDHLNKLSTCVYFQELNYFTRLVNTEIQLFPSLVLPDLLEVTEHQVNKSKLVYQILKRPDRREGL